MRASAMTVALEAHRRQRHREREIALAPAELHEAAAPRIAEQRQAYLGDQLVRPQRRGERGAKEAVRRQGALACAALRDDLCAERRRDQAPFGRGIGVRQAAGKRAPDPDRQMRDVARDPRQERAERAGGHRSLEGDVPGQGADPQPAVLPA